MLDRSLREDTGCHAARDVSCLVGIGSGEYAVGQFSGHSRKEPLLDKVAENVQDGLAIEVLAWTLGALRTLVGKEHPKLFDQRLGAGCWMSCPHSKDLAEQGGQAFVGQTVVFVVVAQLIASEVETCHNVLDDSAFACFPVFLLLYPALNDAVGAFAFLRLLREVLIDGDLRTRERENAAVGVAHEDVAVLHLIEVHHLGLLYDFILVHCSNCLNIVVLQFEPMQLGQHP